MTGVLLALAAGAAFGLSTVLARMAIDRSSVYQAALWSILVTSALLPLPLLVLALRDELGSRNVNALPYFVAAGAVTDFFARSCLYAASARMGASRASAFRVLAPVVTLALGALFLHDRPSPVAAVGVALMLLGLGIIHAGAARAGSSLVAVAPSEVAGGPPPWLPLPRVAQHGIVFGLTAAVAFGVGDILRKGGMEAGATALFGAFVTAATALALHAARGFATGEIRPALVPDRRSLPLLAATGASILVALVLFLSSLRWIPAGVAASVSGTQVLFAIGFGSLLNQTVEAVSLSVVAGGILAFAGLLVVLNG